MNRHSLLAVALIAMVCTGLGVASVSGSQLPLDIPSNMDGIYGMMTLSVVDKDGVTTVATTDGEDEHSFVFDPNEPLPEGFDPITDEDGNVIGASCNATDESGEVVAGFAFTEIGEADLMPHLGMEFDPNEPLPEGCQQVTDDDGNVIGVACYDYGDAEENNGGF